MIGLVRLAVTVLVAWLVVRMIGEPEGSGVQYWVYLLALVWVLDDLVAAVLRAFLPSPRERSRRILYK